MHAHLHKKKRMAATDDDDYSTETELSADSNDEEELSCEKGATRGRRHLTPWEMVQKQKRAKKKEVLFSDQEILERFVAQNVAFTMYESCICVTTKSHNKTSKCNCLQCLLDEDENAMESGETEDGEEIRMAVAKFQLYFARLNREDQMMRFIEWMRYAELSRAAEKSVEGNKLYLIPYIATEETAELCGGSIGTTKICLSALLRLLGKGFSFQKNVKKFFKAGTRPTLGWKNNKNRKRKIFNRFEYMELHQYMEQVATLAEPSATRYVRDVTNLLTTRDDNDESLYLPTYMTKRGVYRQYCESRGKRVITAHTGETQLEDISDDENKECISWTTFHNFWQENFDNLKVCKLHEDICKECYMFANRHKYLNETCLIAGEDKEDANNDMSTGSGKLLFCFCLCFFSSSCITTSFSLFSHRRRVRGFYKFRCRIQF